MAERGAPPLVAVMLVAGLSFAAYRAWTWPSQSRSRSLIVVAPDGAEVSIVGGPPPIDDALGVHTWTVLPGPLTLSVRAEDGDIQRTDLDIPKGLSGLMVEIRMDEAGLLQLGYF